MDKRTPTDATDPFAQDGRRKMVSGFAPLSKFKPHPDNPRTHPENELILLAGILRESGPDQPIVVDEKWEILKGHGRLKAAGIAKLKGFPYVQRFGLSEVEKRKMRIEDNALPLLAGWDQTLLRADAVMLKAAGVDLQTMGFSEPMSNWLTSGNLVTNPDAEWNGMPEFSNPDARAFRSIIMHFHDQAGVEAFAKMSGQVISDKTKFMWYPEIIIKPFVKYTGDGNKKPKAAKKAAKKRSAK